MNWYKKVKKNYYRDDLLKIYNKCEKKPIILTSKYKHSNSIDWAVFSNLKPYINSKCKLSRENYRNYTFCNHINIFRNDILKYIKLTQIHSNKRFLIMANIIKYECNGIKRMGLKLYKEEGIVPIMEISDTRKNCLRKSLFSKFYQYTEEDFIGCNKIKVKAEKDIQISYKPEEPSEDFVFI